MTPLRLTTPAYKLISLCGPIAARRLGVVTAIVTTAILLSPPVKADEVSANDPANTNDVSANIVITDVSPLPPAPGLIFDVRAGEYIMLGELVRRIGDAKYILIGEKHDNPIHHHHQAELIDALSKSGNRHRAVVWEMFTRDQQDSLDQNWHDLTVADLGLAMTWEDRGWPSWQDYAPIAQAARNNDLAMVAGNLPDDILRPMIANGVSALPDDLAKDLSLPDIPADIQVLLDQEIAEGHCDTLPKSMLPAFSTVQFARDASLARAMYDAANSDTTDGAYLIAGAMHVRRGIAAPWHLRRFDTNLTDQDIAVVSLIEADDPSDDPSNIADYALRFGPSDAIDFMWFTNDIVRGNPCDDLKMGQ